MRPSCNAPAIQVLSRSAYRQASSGQADLQRAGDRTAFCPSYIGVLAPAELGGTDGTPGDAEACFIEATERTFQAKNAEACFFRNLDIQHDFASHGGTQGELALDFRC